MVNAKEKQVPLAVSEDFYKFAHSTPDGKERSCPYREIFCNLLYLSLCSRPDISLAVLELARYMSAPRESRWKELKGVVRYIKGTINHGLVYSDERSSSELHFYVDASWEKDISTRRSTTGVLMCIGSHLVDWSSKRQSLISHSTAEAEYIAADSAARMVIWFRSLMDSFCIKHEGPTTLHEDNLACIVLSKGEGKFTSSKHISLRYHYLNEKVREGEITLSYVKTEHQLADFLTKPLPTRRFKELINQVMYDGTDVALLHGTVQVD